MRDVGILPWIALFLVAACIPKSEPKADASFNHHDVCI